MPMAAVMPTAHAHAIGDPALARVDVGKEIGQRASRGRRRQRPSESPARRRWRAAASPTAPSRRTACRAAGCGTSAAARPRCRGRRCARSTTPTGCSSGSSAGPSWRPGRAGPRRCRPRRRGGKDQRVFHAERRDMPGRQVRRESTDRQAAVAPHYASTASARRPCAAERRRSSCGGASNGYGSRMSSVFPAAVSCPDRSCCPRSR